MYSDAGLIGALIVSEAGSAGKAVSAVVSALRSASVTDQQVTSDNHINDPIVNPNGAGGARCAGTIF